MKRNNFTSRVFATVIAVLIVMGAIPVMSVSAETTDDGFAYAISDGEVTINGYYGGEEDIEHLEIPSEIEGCPVTSIGNYAFSGCSNLYSITIPEGVTSIGDYAFSGCDFLSWLDLPESVTSLGEYWLSGCDYLDSITIWGDLKSVEPNIFSGFGGNIEFRGDVTNIEPYTFSGFEGDITFWGDVTNIEPYAFYESGGALVDGYDNGQTIAFNRIEIDGSLTTIEDFAFSGCRAEYIHLSSSVESIGAFAFEGCENLKEMVIYGNIKSIGDAAFVDCFSLETVLIFADNIEHFGQEMFVRCNSLKGVVLPEGITDIGPYTFDCCESLKTIILPDMFYDYESLETETVILPDTVKSIGENAFDYCYEIKNITIPAGVISIGDGAFYDCLSLTDVYYEGTQAQWEQIEIGEYNECLTDATIHYAEPVVEVKGNSITLSGDIGVNFFMKVKDDVLADEDATVIFTYDNNVVEVPVSEGVETENGYKYTCNIPAKDMTTEVTCKVVSSSEESEEFIYSVADYADVILSNSDTYGEQAVALVKAMLNYGAAAQEYFGYNVNNLANDTEYMTDEDRAVPVKDFSNLSYTLTEGAGEVKYYGTSLNLKSEVGIKHYFMLDDAVNAQELAVTVDGESAKLKKNGDLYELIISDIAAHNLYKDYVVQVGDVSLSYCAMDYAASAQKTYNNGLKKIMYALDAYAQSAVAYEN